MCNSSTYSTASTRICLQFMLEMTGSATDIIIKLEKRTVTFDFRELIHSSFKELLRIEKENDVFQVK